jgi:hypothetical protein
MTLPCANVRTEFVLEEKQKVTENIGVTPECGVVRAWTLSPAQVHSVCYKSSEFFEFCNMERLWDSGQLLCCRTFRSAIFGTVGCAAQLGVLHIWVCCTVVDFCTNRAHVLCEMFGSRHAKSGTAVGFCSLPLLPPARIFPSVTFVRSCTYYGRCVMLLNDSVFKRNP